MHSGFLRKYLEKGAAHQGKEERKGIAAPRLPGTNLRTDLPSHTMGGSAGPLVIPVPPVGGGRAGSSKVSFSLPRPPTTGKEGQRRGLTPHADVQGSELRCKETRAADPFRVGVSLTLTQVGTVTKPPGVAFLPDIHVFHRTVKAR